MAKQKSNSNRGGARPGSGPKIKFVTISVDDLARAIYSECLVRDNSCPELQEMVRSETVVKIRNWLQDTELPKHPALCDLVAEWRKYTG